MGSNYVQEREAICRNPPDTLGRKRLAGSRCHSQVVTKAMHGVKGHSWYWEVGYARNTTPPPLLAMVPIAENA